MTAEAFRAAVEAHDLDAMMDVFADDVLFHSPIVFKTYRGKDELRFVLARRHGHLVRSDAGHAHRHHAVRNQTGRTLRNRPVTGSRANPISEMNWANLL